MYSTFDYQFQLVPSIGGPICIPIPSICCEWYTYARSNLLPNHSESKHTLLLLLKPVKELRFSDKVAVTLIISRQELRDLGADLWWADTDIQRAKKEAEMDIEDTLTAHGSGLNLYSTMDLIHRPCMENGIRNQFRILVIDDSVICRKMVMFKIAKGHKEADLGESLFLKQAASYDQAQAAMEIDNYNIVFVDENLGKEPFGHQLIPHIRRHNEACVIVGISSLINDPKQGPEVHKRFTDNGADFVWGKPIPSHRKVWEKLLEYLPMEF